MKDAWERRVAIVELDNAALGRLVRPVFRGARVIEAAPLTGGKANTCYRLRLAGRVEPVLLRLFVRDPKAAAIEAAVLRLVGGRIPIAEYLHFETTNPVSGHPYAVAEWIEGERLDQAMQTASVADRKSLARHVGRTLAAIGSFHFDTYGFFDADLEVVRKVDGDASGLRQFMRASLFDGGAADRLDAKLRDRLWRFVDAEAAILDRWPGPPCLTHADFGADNILVRRSGTGWEVAAVLDWEFAFSGSPLFDIGHILREPTGDAPEFEAALIDGYVAGGGKLTDNWKPMAKLVDLTAWVDFLNQGGDRPNLHGAARAAITATMDRWPSYFQ